MRHEWTDENGSWRATDDGGGPEVFEVIPPSDPRSRSAASSIGAGVDPRSPAAREILRLAARDLRTFDQIAADRLADEVAALVTRGFLDSRSAAADALLDYREPPRTPRSDRIAALEADYAARTDEMRLRLAALDEENRQLRERAEAAELRAAINADALKAESRAASFDTGEAA